MPCEGHPAGPFDPMGETVYCDGSCQPQPDPQPDPDPIANTPRAVATAVTSMLTEGYRLIGVARVHREKMLRELGDPDGRRQRGNAFAFGYADGRLAGLANALRLLGDHGAADRLEHDYNETFPEAAQIRPAA